jgi:uncharacterized repeat protein (TIGR01451 family)
MRHKWLIPGAAALFVLALVILLSQGTGRAQVPQSDLVVTKSVAQPVIAPGKSVVYTVTLSNTSAVTLEVSSLVDTLPAGFEYVGLAPGSDWSVEPWDDMAPEIEWAGPISVPVSGQVSLRYWVYVPGTTALSAEPYTNTVVATVGVEQYTAEAGLQVAIGEVTVSKLASGTRVQPGELVTYTIALSNSGYVPVPLAVMSDAMPAEITFMNMTADSDIHTDPVDMDGTMAWTGPFTIGSHDQFRVRYLAAMPSVSDTLSLENQAWGRLGDGTVVGPASRGVVVSSGGPTTITLPLILRNYAPPAFTVSKTAEPTEAYAQDPGVLVAYTVVFENIGTVPGELADIRDQLPPGFTFVQMLAGSDVMVGPAGTTGEIVWNGPFAVPGQSAVTLKYQVRASSVVGQYVNSATGTASVGKPPAAPATATVNILEPLLMQEDFENPSPYWEKFLNATRLRDEQWFYDPDDGYGGGGVLKHTYWLGVTDPEDGAHDALIMYKAPGAEQWTDYIFEAKAVLFFDDGTDRGKFGVWVRGTANQVNQPLGRYVTGYYLTLQPVPMIVDLWQLRTDDECGDDCNYNYHFSNPILLKRLRGHGDLDPLGLSIDWGRWYTIRVEVQGPQIRCYVDGVQVFDYYDDFGTTFTAGTVGFYTYIAGDARFDDVTVKPWQ